MGAGLKKDLRVSRVRPVGSLNALFFLLIEVISQILPMVRKRGGTSTLGERTQLVELRSCNWVVAITGWVSNCPG
ncbi:hypothetical protein EUTSA_v10029308mg, partial [Eutrema salsugineum]